MCGICGFTKDVYIERPNELVEEMLNVLRHRGPDDKGVFKDEFVALGVCRLSIIDLEKGNQPIFNEDRSKAVIFNGEIYNFNELREELENRGHLFYTHSDTEVIIHLYEDFGTECVNRLNGMFAFAIWDRYKKELFLARDRLGVKPIYYTLIGGCLVFASELKAILKFHTTAREIDITSLSQYLTFEYIPSPRTIFKGIYKLPAGYWLLYKDGIVKIEKYWDINWSAGSEISNTKEYVARIRDFIKDSVRCRLVSDVPLGFFLSGGIDSSSLVAFAKELNVRQIKTFSIGFEVDSFDERTYFNEVSNHFSTEHRYEIFNINDMVELISEIYKYLDEPFADPSIFPTFYLSKFARKYVKVAIAGDGGDELFAGYPTYVAHRFASIYKVIPNSVRKYIIEKIIKATPVSMGNLSFDYLAKKFISGMGFPPHIRNILWIGGFNENEKRVLLTNLGQQQIKEIDTFDFLEKYLRHCKGKDLITTMQYLDLKTYLQDGLLVKIDRASMAHALEVRVPYLDYRLVEWAFNLPTNLRLHCFETKHILKMGMRGYLPQNIIYRKKKGFGIPVSYWLKGRLRNFVFDTLSADRIKRQGLFNYDYIKEIIQEHLLNKKDNRKQIWTLLMFELWYDRYVRQTD